MRWGVAGGKQRTASCGKGVELRKAASPSALYALLQLSAAITTSASRLVFSSSRQGPFMPFHTNPCTQLPYQSCSSPSPLPSRPVRESVLRHLEAARAALPPEPERKGKGGGVLQGLL